MKLFDKDEVKDQLETEDIYEILNDWGASPEYMVGGLNCTTICHNLPGEGSRKLMYYENTRLFKCYTGCSDSFDIFELCCRVQDIQYGRLYDLNQAVLYIAERLGIEGVSIEAASNSLPDWKILTSYEKLKEKSTSNHFSYKELNSYNEDILNRLTTIRIYDWEVEGISAGVINDAEIKYHPGVESIAIPHYDLKGRLVGVRGRSLSQENCLMYGKYRPLTMNGTLHTHPLGLNLYNANNSYKNIRKMRKAIIFEGEKSCLRYRTEFGSSSDISVACCGSNISAYQMELLMRIGAEEVVVALDRQFQTIGDKEFEHLKKILQRLHSRYSNYVNISFIFDKKRITRYKSSPIDESREKFEQLLKERLVL